MATSDQHSTPIWETMNHEPSSYALNGKIMLSSVIVLFFAVFFILYFRAHARWLSRRRYRRYRRRIRARLRSFSASPDPYLVPLDRTMLEKIPVFVYAPPKNTDAPPLECAVCLSEFEEDDEGRVLPKCRHAFHVDCIDTWFRSRSSCPLCRAPVQPTNRSDQPTSETTEPASPVCPPVKKSNVSETGGSSSSPSPGIFPPPERCPRQPIELVGIVVEMPRESDGPNTGLPSENGSKFPGNWILSLTRLWSI